VTERNKVPQSCHGLVGPDAYLLRPCPWNDCQKHEPKQIHPLSTFATDERLPTVGTIAKIAAALGVSAPWLAYGLGDTTADSAATCEGMGLRLQTVRVERDHTKASLARLAGLTAPSIAQIENGGQAGVDTIEALAKALGVSPGWLAYGVGPIEPPARRRARPAAAAN